MERRGWPLVLGLTLTGLVLQFVLLPFIAIGPWPQMILLAIIMLAMTVMWGAFGPGRPASPPLLLPGMLGRVPGILAPAICLPMLANYESVGFVAAIWGCALAVLALASSLLCMVLDKTETVPLRRRLEALSLNAMMLPGCGIGVALLVAPWLFGLFFLPSSGQDFFHVIKGGLALAGFFVATLTILAVGGWCLVAASLGRRLDLSRG